MSVHSKIYSREPCSGLVDRHTIRSHGCASLAPLKRCAISRHWYQVQADVVRTKLLRAHGSVKSFVFLFVPSFSIATGFYGDGGPGLKKLGFLTNTMSR